MNGRIRRCGAYVFKRFATPADAAAAANRSELLRQAGVQTASASNRARSRLVRFDLIEAEASLSIITKQGNSVLTGMMQGLAALHAIKPFPNLLPYNPMRKITPRLPQAGSGALSALAQGAFAELRGQPPVRRLVHGDLHANQFLINANGDCWIIDFDDLAIGDPAVDLGNFAAHLATRPETASGAPLDAMRRWLATAMHIYHQAGGVASTQSADVYGRIALVRRVLKLQKSQPGAFVDQLLVGLNETN